MNTETIFIFAMAAISALLLWRSRNITAPEPVYDAVVRHYPDHAVQAFVATIAIVWVPVQGLRALGLLI